MNIKPIKPEDDGFMEIEEDGNFWFCGDAFYGKYTKEALRRLIENLCYFLKEMEQ